MATEKWQSSESVGIRRQFLPHQEGPLVPILGVWIGTWMSCVPAY